MTAEHQVTVEYQHGRRTPWVPTCTCGKQFWGYPAEHAAWTIAKAHRNGEDTPEALKAYFDATRSPEGFI